ncbi:TPA: hypothetical protein ACH3X2_004955 [Trebouxia sp. C0005]
MQDQITAVKNLGASSRPCYAGYKKAIDHDLDMLETTGEDPARLDTLSALAAEMEGYQLLKDQSLSNTLCRPGASSYELT